MGKFSYFYVIPSCQSLSGDPINIHCLFGNFSTDVFSQLPFLRQMTWQLLELLIQSHLVKLLSNLPLRPLSVLVRVGLADPVSPVALSKQESHRGGLWQSDGTEWSGGDRYSTNKGGINNKNEKIIYFLEGSPNLTNQSCDLQILAEMLHFLQSLCQILVKYKTLKDSPPRYFFLPRPSVFLPFY